jgi:predicted kinase
MSNESISGLAIKSILCVVRAVILVGLQGSGKSTFYERRFANTHLRISRDIAATVPREQRLLEECITRKLDFVVDNTNATIESRRRFIEPAKSAGYRIIGYYFTTDIKECLARNALRSGNAKVPVPGIYRARKMMQPPTLQEGFDELYEVAPLSNGDMAIVPLG